MGWHILYNILGVSHYLLLKNVDETTFHSTFKPILFYFHTGYFVVDTVIEMLYYDRYLYIIHHLVSVAEIVIIKNNKIDYFTMQQIIKMYSYLEVNSLIVNLREDLKKRNKLTVPIDCALILVYTYVRAFMFPYFIYTYLHTYPQIAIIPWIIYSVSMIWLYQWSNSLKKRIQQ